MCQVGWLRLRHDIRHMWGVASPQFGRLHIVSSHEISSSLRRDIRDRLWISIFRCSHLELTSSLTNSVAAPKSPPRICSHHPRPFPKPPEAAHSAISNSLVASDSSKRTNDLPLLGRNCVSPQHRLRAVEADYFLRAVAFPFFSRSRVLPRPCMEFLSPCLVGC